MPNELFTRKETSSIFGVKHRTIWKWEKRGVIKPSLYVNGRPRYSIEEIERVASLKNNVQSETEKQ